MLLSELLHQIEDCGARVLFASSATLPVVLACSKKLSIPNSNIFLLDGTKDGIDGLDRLLQNDGQSWTRLTTFEEVKST